MASPTSGHPDHYSSSTATNTTFVQADPSNFRAVVQHLTGASPDSSSPKLPITLPTRLAAPRPPTPTPAPDIGPRRPPFKLHERRQSVRKLEIKLGAAIHAPPPSPPSSNSSSSSSSSAAAAARHQRGFVGFPGEMMMVSPVSPLELFSPRTPRSPVEEEERAIAGKGFYLHPSPLSTPRASEPPELLPLFPLHSPRHHHSSSSSS